MKRFFLLLAAAGAYFAAIAQKADYTAAEKYDAPQLRDKVGSLSIIPFFFGDSDQFWFLQDGGRSMPGNYYFVDPAIKEKHLLYDKPFILTKLAELRKEKIDSSSVNYASALKSAAGQQTVKVIYKNVSYDYNFYHHTLKAADPELKPAYIPGTPGTMSPDRKWQLYARNHNLYLCKSGDTANTALSSDASLYHSFCLNEFDTTTGITPTNAVWLPGSQQFYIVRKDNRRVGTLSLVHSLFFSGPRLETYKYQLPGDKEVTQYELFVGDVATRKLVKIDAGKWKDQEISVIEKGHTREEIYFLRKKRTCDEIELCAGNMKTGNVRIIINEVSKPYINYDLFNVSILNQGRDIIWWSDRTGWGHYYLYNGEGQLKKVLTHGDWTAGRILYKDTSGRYFYFYGYGREQGRNPYYAHVYKASLDGGDISLLTPENATHSVFVSPSGKYLLDNYSTINTQPFTVLRNNKGAFVMEVAKTDLKQLYDYGWRPPEPFTVKAADGITDLYGLMWKPFDFDSTRKYPIISQVYPGPQIETVWSDFTVYDKYINTPLAQLGFIVVCMGHRGGSPLRNKKYYSYGYDNLRDYPLEDDKHGLEQLAHRFNFIDINRLGIFGHSGGAAMATAAICTYPDFYKVAVASSGNHDNTIYNRNYGESYHGVKEVIDSATHKSSFTFKTQTNQSLAKNLKGHLLLVTGEVDANVHPGNTYRMVDALVKAGKDFDMLVLPGQSHRYEGVYKYFFENKLRHYFGKYLIEDFEK